MAKAASKKKKSISLKPRAQPTAPRPKSVMVEERHVGRETTDWASVENMEPAVYDTLRHYAYFYNAKDWIKWAREWVKANKTKTEYRHFTLAEDWRVSPTVCGIAKMILNGAKFDQPTLDWLNSKISEIISVGMSKDKQKSASPALAERKSVSDLVKDKTSEFIAEVEEIVDTWEDQSEYSVYDEMKKLEVPYATAKATHEYYTRLYDELVELTTNKPEDLVEAYTKFLGGIRKQKQYMAFVKKILDDSEMYMSSKKAVRKPRTKKVTSANQQVAKVSFQKESSEYKVASIDPVNIVGATTVYLFNTKTREIVLLNTSSSTGFTVKGTTIQDIDLEDSFKKKVRKPEEFLSNITKTTKAKVKKVFDDLTTKPAEANGRLNADTIILKAYK